MRGAPGKHQNILQFCSCSDFKKIHGEKLLPNIHSKKNMVRYMIIFYRIYKVTLFSIT